MPEGFPSWAGEDIVKADWKYLDTRKGSGYILEKYPDERRLDIQFFDRLPDGRFIASVDLSSELSPDNLEKGGVYLFEYKVYVAALSRRLAEYLAQHYSLKMDSICRFELAGVEKFE